MMRLYIVFIHYNDGDDENCDNDDDVNGEKPQTSNINGRYKRSALRQRQRWVLAPIQI